VDAMSIKWNKISNSIIKIYADHELDSNYESDSKYLMEAFEFTEILWEKQFDRIDDLKVVMLSEAPLFGERKTYIYNPATNPTAFFYYQDLNAFPTFNNDLNPKRVEEKKEIMFEQFAKNGFLVLNIFPFALNPKDTSINYQRMGKKLYKELLDVTTESYLLPKLAQSFKKAKGTIKFIYRYKRLFEKTGFHVNNVLKENFNHRKFNVKSVHGTNMSMDRDKLAEYLKK
jgi:hypothetical protein